MNIRYFISASLPVAVADDRLFARRLQVLVHFSRLQALIDLPVSRAHAARPLV
jgi:hypothetical protein